MTHRSYIEVTAEDLEPDRVVLCRPGEWARVRSWLDRRGDYGVGVRESPYLPASLRPGEVVEVDVRRLDSSEFSLLWATRG